uniref:Large ribosomal subunit protein uL22m n=1 Tax=Phallusia mammillata TaxID=59560 RepID=A0A6F9DKJ1_9ASCI|nr:39S ribosomal protein L22, mitochondrial-like [Phallusia mammillata]
MLSNAKKVQALLLNVGVRSFVTTNVAWGSKKPGQHMKIKRHAAQHENKYGRDLGSWTDKNNIVYPPLDDGKRPVEIYYGRSNVRYSPRKMIAIARLIRNKNIDSAIAQLEYINTKGSFVIRAVLMEAQEYAVHEHNLEFKSNLHVVQSFVHRADIITFPIFHARGRPQKGQCYFSDYFVHLREGEIEPYVPRVTAQEMALNYLNSLRHRTIKDGL